MKILKKVLFLGIRLRQDIFNIMKQYKKKLPILLLCSLLLVSCSKKTETAYPSATGPEDLKGYTVTVLAGSQCDLKFEQNAPGAKKQILNNISDLFVALDSDKAQFLMIDSVTVVGIDKQRHQIEAAYSISSIPGNIGLAFRKTDVVLCHQFNEFLALIKADGTYDAMRDRWISDKVNTSEMPEIEEYTEGTPLKVGEIVMFPCCFSKNGEWVGFEGELIKRFAAYLKRPVQIDIYEFSSLMAGLKTGVIDIWCSFVTITEERAKEVLFSDPYIASPATVFQKTGSSVEEVPLYKKVAESFRNNILAERRWKMILDGLWETIVISFFSLLLGTLLGAFVCILRKSKRRFFSDFAAIYIEILHGIPMLVLLMVMFYVVLAPTGLSGRWVAIISFAINFSAYTSEIFKTGIDSVDKGQTEAGLAMGFSKIGTFFNFIVPQALKNILPVFKGEAISLIKGTSIVGYVAIQDLTKMSDIIRARTFDAFFPLILISIIYFILAWLFGKALDSLTKKIS